MAVSTAALVAFPRKMPSNARPFSTTAKFYAHGFRRGQAASDTAKLVALERANAWYDIETHSGKSYLRVGGLWANKSAFWLRVSITFRVRGTADTASMGKCRAATAMAAGERVRMWCDIGIPSPPRSTGLRALVERSHAEATSFDSVSAEIGDLRLDTLERDNWQTVLGIDGRVQPRVGGGGDALPYYRIYNAAGERVGACEGTEGFLQPDGSDRPMGGGSICAIVPARLGRIARVHALLVAHRLTMVVRGPREPPERSPSPACGHDTTAAPQTSITGRGAAPTLPRISAESIGPLPLDASLGTLRARFCAVDTTWAGEPGSPPFPALRFSVRGLTVIAEQFSMALNLSQPAENWVVLPGNALLPRGLQLNGTTWVDLRKAYTGRVVIAGSWELYAMFCSVPGLAFGLRSDPGDIKVDSLGNPLNLPPDTRVDWVGVFRGDQSSVDRCAGSG